MSSTAPEATTATCKYPGCENEPRAAEDGAGAKPKYCGLPDLLTGKPHGPGTAYRRRQELRQDGTAEADDMDRPVSMATTRAAELRRGIQVDIAALTGKLAGLVEQLERAGDLESAEAEIEAVQRETRQQVDAAETRAAQEVLRRQAANTEAEEARIVVLEAEERRQAAEDARGQAEQRAAEARAEDARAEAARVREDAAREAGQLRADAARERAGLEVQARVLEESRSELRVRAERAERDLDAVRAELTRLRQED